MPNAKPRIKRQLRHVSVPGAKAPLAKQLSAFEQAVDVETLDDVEWEQAQKRTRDVAALATRLAANANDARVAEVLTRVVREHPDPDLRMEVANAIVAAGAPARALALIARWIDDADQAYWNWVAGARAVLRFERSNAFEKLAAHLANKTLADRVLVALQQHEGEVDPRFFDAAVRWLPDAPGTPDSQAFLQKHGQRDEVQALIVRATEKLAAGRAEPKWGYFYGASGNRVGLRRGPLRGVTALLSAGA